MFDNNDSFFNKNCRFFEYFVKNVSYMLAFCKFIIYTFVKNWGEENDRYI